MSVRLIITVAVEDTGAANRIAGALGWGYENFTIPTALEADPTTRTHTGLIVRADESTVAIFVAATGGAAPEDLNPDDLADALARADQADLEAIRRSIQITTVPLDQSAGDQPDYGAHCAAHGLVRMVAVVEI